MIDAAGSVESALEISRSPREAPDAFVRAAIDAVKAAKFTPSSRDGRPIRSRIEYVVVFHPTGPDGDRPRQPTPTSAPIPRRRRPRPSPRPSAYRASPGPRPRGLGDVAIDREALTASPRQQTSEMLSAAPGFFVDHEDGEGLGNDVYLRGFDLDNGSGIEMKVGEVPINIPLHIHGQGYADVNFIIPEVVRSIRVLEGPYDPRQGDSAIVGSALFDLGVPDRGYQLKTTLRLVRPGAHRRHRGAEGGERRDVRRLLAPRDAGLRRGPRVEVGFGQRAVRRGPRRRATTCASWRRPTPRAGRSPASCARTT